MDEKTITIIRVVIIFLSLSGYGTLLKRNLKIPTNFIPIILFSGVMIIEYFSALIGLLPIITNIVYLLGLIISFRYLFEFILNFRKILFKKRKKSTRFNIQIKFVHPKLIIKKYLSLIKSKVNKSFQEGLKHQNKEIIFINFLISNLIGFSIAYHVDFNQPMKMKIHLFLIFTVATFGLNFIFFSLFLYRLFNRKRNYSIILLVLITTILSIILVAKNFPQLIYLHTQTHKIEIINTGDKNVKSQGKEVKLAGLLYDSITKKYIANDDLLNQQIIKNGIKYYTIPQKVTIYFDSNYLSNFHLTFYSDSQSGIARINIDGRIKEIDLYNQKESVEVIDFPINWNFRTILIVLIDSFSINYCIWLLIISLLILINSLWARLDENTVLKIKHFSFPGVLIFFFIYILIFFITRNFVFSSVDEFSHWGTYVKELSIINKLPGKEFCTGAPTYIPGYSLFQYFFIKFIGFKEGHVYFTHTIFLFAGVFVLIGDIQFEKILSKFLIIIGAMFGLFFLPLNSLLMYVDASIGILFGASIIGYVFFKEQQINKLYLIILLCAIQTIKTWGVILACISFCIIILNEIRELKTTEEKKEMNLFIILFVCLTLIIQGSWLAYMYINGILSNNIGYFNKMDYIINTRNYSILNKESILLFVKNFISIIFKGRGFGFNYPFSIINFSIFLLFLGLICSSLDIIRFKEIRRVNQYMFLFFFINIILLLFSYFFYFSTYDMVRLASIERYISEYFLGWLIFVLYEIDTINILPTIKHNNSSLFIMLSLIIVLFFGFLTNNNFKIPPTSFTNQRLQIQNELKNIDTILSKDQIRKKVFIIDLKDNSDRHQIFRYELCPNLVQMWGWSVRINPDNNYFTIIKSPNEFLNEMIQNFDFILVWNADDLFYKEYGNLFNDFSITEPNIFQVTKTGFIKLN